jgi:hypothetical protein
VKPAKVTGAGSSFTLNALAGPGRGARQKNV